MKCQLHRWSHWRPSHTCGWTHVRAQAAFESSPKAASGDERSTETLCALRLCSELACKAHPDLQEMMRAQQNTSYTYNLLSALVACLVSFKDGACCPVPFPSLAYGRLFLEYS